jgi:hypothetical protein
MEPVPGRISDRPVTVRPVIADPHYLDSNESSQTQKFKPIPIESTSQKCKRFIKMTEADDEIDENNKENK